MQENFIKAFRQRLVRAGFTNIRIYDENVTLFFVHCVSPEGKKIERLMTKYEILNTPKLVWFD